METSNLPKTIQSELFISNIIDINLVKEVEKRRLKLYRKKIKMDNVRIQLTSFFHEIDLSTFFFLVEKYKINYKQDLQDSERAYYSATLSIHNNETHLNEKKIYLFSKHFTIKIVKNINHEIIK